MDKQKRALKGDARGGMAALDVRRPLGGAICDEVLGRRGLPCRGLLMEMREGQFSALANGWFRSMSRGLKPQMDDLSKGVEPTALKETDAPQDGWDDPVRGRIHWRTLFSRGRTRSEGITCGVAELGPGDWLGLHRHAPPETYYVLAGAGIVCLDGREIAVRAGSAVFIPGMAEHGVRQTGIEVLRLFYAFPVDSFDNVEYLFSRV